MKRIFLILSVMFLLACGTSAWGVTCSSQTYDYGPCDTIYNGPWESDTLLVGDGPFFVRFPIYVTFDPGDTLVKNPIPEDTTTYPTITDSIMGFVFPFCFTHSNPTKYCSVSYYWNNYTSFTNPRSIFRHLVEDGDTIHNWMMDLFKAGNGEEWNYEYLNLDGTSHFWLVLFPSGTEDRRFGLGSKVLLGTMTFKLEDSMQICIDSCLWPPSNRLEWANSIAGCQTYVPRLGTPHQNPEDYEVCFNLRRSTFLCGDANGDGIIDIGDVVYLINYQFKNGPAPIPLQAGDVNRDGVVDVEDVVYLINYLFKGGPAPSC